MDRGFNRELLIIKYEKNIYIYDLFRFPCIWWMRLEFGTGEWGHFLIIIFKKNPIVRPLLRQMEADLRVIWSAVTFPGAHGAADRPGL